MTIVLVYLIMRKIYKELEVILKCKIIVMTTKSFQIMMKEVNWN
jgi:hypothetical protein